MSYGLWLSTAGMQVNEYRQTVMANNLANTSTTGFKHDLAIFMERGVESVASGGKRFSNDVLDDMTGGTFVQPTVHTFAQGDLDKTDNPLDVAVFGEGFLSVQDGDETKFTRDGRMTINGRGELVLAAGGGRLRVLDDQGQPIRLDLEAGESFSVSRDGQLWQGSDSVAKLGVVEFEDRAQLVKHGGNLYANHGSAERSSTSELRAGFLEQSTANPMSGLAAMIETARAYQLNANLVSLQDTTIGQAVNTVGRVR